MITPISAAAQSYASRQPNTPPPQETEAVQQAQSEPAKPITPAAEAKPVEPEEKRAKPEGMGRHVDVSL